MTTLQVRSHAGSLVCSCSPHPSLRSFHGSQPSDASAIALVRPCKLRSTWLGPFSGKDERGEWQIYTCSYFHDGAWWVVSVSAYGFEDARARLKKLPLAQIDGTLEAVIPAFYGASLLLSLYGALRSVVRFLLLS